ncbi:Cytoplasmic polyadenylation element-binding protein 2 [Araneus ventricosus]|uniref:Cytoplasmic polyadenylation element-binding protein 2 n=1 Tax=Araneus ventricosus TaxID=182803 RepID=A0A4Y2LZ66_ARAVE|nr:Cytoplasmic polyadenylation element-binding protein 2 [Araneus ventricosus]
MKAKNNYLYVIPRFSAMYLIVKDNIRAFLIDFLLVRFEGKSPFFTGLDENHLDDGHLEQMGPSLNSSMLCAPKSPNNDTGERFSRKVFVGGLPPDIDEDEINASFRRFGPLVVDWPHKAESKSYFPPKGYAFLLFQDEASVQALIDACIQEDDKLYLCVSSPTIKDKPVQIRPWRLSDADFVLDASMPLDPRKTVFVGGVPRPLKARKLLAFENAVSKVSRTCIEAVKVL